MFHRKEYADTEKKKCARQAPNPIESKVIVRDGAIYININEKLNVVPGVYELQDNGSTYAVGSDMLKGIRKFFKFFMKSKNGPFPTLLLWYKGLSKDEKKTVMVISKERAENDSLLNRQTKRL